MRPQYIIVTNTQMFQNECPGMIAHFVNAYDIRNRVCLGYYYQIVLNHCAN
jgi:hypothetical protein